MKHTLQHIEIEQTKADETQTSYKIKDLKTKKTWHMDKWKDGTIGGSTPEALENSLAEKEAIQYIESH